MSRASRAAVENSKSCRTTRTALETPLRVTASRDRSALRSARAHRGLDRWECALRWDRVNVRYVRFITLTTESPDVGVVTGRMEELWHRIRSRWPNARYFWKLEIQARGAAHYHMFWINAPTIAKGFTLKWLTGVWGLGFVHEKRIPGSVWKRSGAGYLRSYLKKHGAKSYQEDYAEVPSYIRTYGSNVKGYDARELDAHVSRWECVYDGGALVLTAKLSHGPGNRCAAPLGTAERAAARRREKQGRRLARLWAGHSRAVSQCGVASREPAPVPRSRRRSQSSRAPSPNVVPCLDTPAELELRQGNLFTGVAMVVASSASKA